VGVRPSTPPRYGIARGAVAVGRVRRGYPTTGAR